MWNQLGLDVLYLLMCWNIGMKNIIPDGRIPDSETNTTFVFHDTTVTNVKMEGGDIWIDHMTATPWMDIDIVKLKDNVRWTSRTKWNKLVHSKNGNRINSRQFRVVHWNAGSRLWQNKLLDIENFCTDKKPDLCFISEANLWEDVEISDRVIPGHYLVLPNTMRTLKHARLVLVVRNGLSVQVLTKEMDTDTATIWVKIGSKKMA